MREGTLESSLELQQQLREYLERYPKEKNVIEVGPIVGNEHRALPLFLASTKGAALYDRMNFNGHLTASAFILDATGKKVLLLHHKSLDRWLQPGGHIDATDASILAAAYREASEETGIIKDDVELIQVGESASLPFDLDSHYIPANPKKQEAEHVHHDVRFLFQLKAGVVVEINAEESTAYRWVALEELLNLDDHRRVAEKVLALSELF